MLFGKRKELDEEKIEQVMEDFTKVLSKLMEKHLPRRMRRAMPKKSKWGKMNDKKKKEELTKIKKRGLNSWLSETVYEICQEVGSFANDPDALEKDLKASLKEFKKTGRFFK